MALVPLSAGLQSFPPLPTIKLGPSGADFPSGWACVCTRTLWVSPTNSPVRLGVSPAAASTPTDVFSQLFEALFPRSGALGCTAVSGFTSCCLAGQLQPCPPRSTIHRLTGSASRCLATSPFHPAARLRPSYRSGWMCLLYLLGCWTSMQFDFLSFLVVFVFKLLLSFFWLCEEAQCVYLHLHLIQKWIRYCMFLTDENVENNSGGWGEEIEEVSFLVSNVLNLQVNFTRAASLMSHNNHHRSISKSIADRENISTPLVR